MKSKFAKHYVQVQSCGQGYVSRRLYTYSLPNDIEVAVGSVVKIKFGRKQTLAVVKKLGSTKPKHINKILEIDAVIENIVLPEYFLELADWISQYYVASPKATWSMLLPSGLSAKLRHRNLRAGRKLKLTKLNTLTSSQKKALQIINKQKTTLLHGVTGSGKTEIYLHLINQQIQNKKSSIVLVPEIMLTTQIEQRLKEHFANVFVLHSSLTATQRKRQWLQACQSSRAGKAVVVLGTRSALFTPLHNLGLIIIDEEHEPSYKQESTPRYEAQFVAAQITKLTNSKLILGSATPSLRSYYLSNLQKIGYATLPARHKSSLPQVEVVPKPKSSEAIISSYLKSEIDNTLKRRKQVMLFLNRRGSAKAMICQNCGNINNCPNCHVSTHYHADLNQLVCHYCNFSTAPSTVCELCYSSDIKLIGDGTKKLEAEIKATWPQAKVARVDSDNAKYDYLIETFKKLQYSKIDIVIGTQMISRGLDIENLSLVGVVDADSMLAIGDYSAGERSFQLISQVAGRAGRRGEIGTVVVQTTNQNNPIIQTSAHHNYKNFFEYESGLRKRYTYPPYCFLLKLQYANRYEKVALQKAIELVNSLKRKKLVVVLGPVKYFRRTLQKQTVYQVVVKSKQRQILQEIVRCLPPKWNFDIDPINIL